MKYVQSFWSKPFFDEASDNVYGRSRGGWNSNKFFYMSVALSCLLINKYLGDVFLYTDNLGEDILVNKLKLPFSSVENKLNILDKYNKDIWSVGKIYTYTLQNEPFIHFDSDIFIWNKLSPSLLNSPLISQNQEVNFHIDVEILERMRLVFQYFPRVIMDNYNKNIVSCNAGILGGTNFKFFKEYGKIAFDFIDNNIYSLRNDNINVGYTNMIFEQYTFSCLAKERNIDISFFFKDISNDYFTYLCNFKKTKQNFKYIHIIGPYKKLKLSEIWLESQLRLEFPEFYYRLAFLLKKNIIY